MNPQSTLCSVSLCLIAKNSEATLTRTLRSVSSLVQEILLVDTGSTDRTIEIAQQFGATILHSLWNDNFSETRNIGLAAARCRWILVLDSDEWMLEKDVHELRKLLLAEPSSQETPQKAFRLLNKSLTKAGQSGGVAAYLTRLFPNHPQVRYCFPIHEQVDSSLHRAGIQIHDAPIQILHDGYCDPAIRRQKQERNLKILEKQILTEPPLPITRFLLAGCFLDLGRTNDALDAYLSAFESAHKRQHTSVANASLVRICTCLFALDRFQEALAFYEQIHGEAASHPELVITHAKTLNALGRSPEALAVMETVLELPDIPRLPPFDHEAALFEATQWTTTEAFRSAFGGHLP